MSNKMCYNMCCNSLLNLFYIGGVTLGGILTLVALTTPAWRQAKSDAKSTEDAMQVGQRTYGIVAGYCNGSCIDYFQNQPGWKKGVLASMVLALFCCVAGLVWSFLACFACCCTTFLVSPLPTFAGLACGLDIVGVTLYAAKSGQNYDNMPQSQAAMESQSDMGYSFWIGISAIAILLITTIIGVLLVKVDKVTPM